MDTRGYYDMHIHVSVLLIVLKLYLQTAAINCPSQYSQHRYYSNKCYHVSSSTDKGINYNSYCNSIGGAMVSVHNQEIQAFISSTLLSFNYYIGLLWSTSPSYVYTWKDGHSLLWSLLPGSPSGTHDTMVYVDSNGQWEYDIDTHQKYFACDYTIGQTTDTHLALVGGNSMCGRVEVYHEGLWGTISDPNPDAAFGYFVCNQFGYDFGQFKPTCTVSVGTGKIWLDACHCPTNATTINDCVLHWGSAAVSHDNDVYVSCIVKTTTTSTKPTTLTSTATTTTQSTTQTTTTATTTAQDITKTTTTATTTVQNTTQPMDTTTQTGTTTEITTIDSSTVQNYCFYNCNVTYNLTETITITQTVTETVTASSSSSSLLYSSSAFPVNVTTNVTTEQDQPTKYSKKSSAMYSTTTVYDMRPSAVVVGSAGVIVLVVVVAFIIGTDCYFVFMFILNLMKNMLVKRSEAFKQLKGKDAAEMNIYSVYAEDLDIPQISAEPKPTAISAEPKPTAMPKRTLKTKKKN